jgi:heme/copper-type cytochrome/quinol oxidase subunit 3
LFLGSSYPAAWMEGSGHLNVWLGTINTVILLCSSLAMAMAVWAAQTGKRDKLLKFLLLTMLLGSVFLGIKAFEYKEKFTHDLVPVKGMFHLDHVEDPNVNPANVQLFFAFSSA